MTADGNRTPLLLIAGFLGAGKTTLLAELLPRLLREGITPHVILNDFQNAEVDAARLRAIYRQIVPVSGSCVCCGSRDEFLDALAGLPPLSKSVVLVEANGAADTAELLEMLAADPRASCLQEPAQVTVVDASRWQLRAWNNEIERAQVRTASHLFVNRAAGLDAQRQQQVEADLIACNPRACRVGLAALAQKLTEWVAENPADPRRAERPDRSARLPHRVHHVSAWEAPLPPSVSEPSLREFLHSIPAYVIRAKGVAFIAGGRAVLFQRTDSGAESTLLELGDPEGLTPKVIFIGPDLDCAALEHCVKTIELAADNANRRG